jgi:hypothetical protein
MQLSSYLWLQRNSARALVEAVLTDRQLLLQSRSVLLRILERHTLEPTAGELASYSK